MIVLHALPLPRVVDPDQCLFVWGEDGGLAPGEQDRATHPFQVRPATLRAVVAELPGGKQLVQAGKRGYVTLRLPTLNGAPVPSPQLLIPPRAGRARKPRWADWPVQGLRVPLPDAVSWLAALPLGEEVFDSAKGIAVVPGADARFWSAAGKLALELLVRGRYAPGAAPVEPGNPDVLAGVWLPVLTDSADRQRLELLEASFPDVCRAAWQLGRKKRKPDADTRPPATPRGVLREFLETVVDGCVRNWLAEGEPKTASDSDRVKPLEQAWLDSLRGERSQIRARAGRLQQLWAALTTWAQELTAAKVPLRTCFRLEPPDASADAEDGVVSPDKWNLGFFLQSTDDPSLLVPAADVWRKKRSSRLKVFKLDRPQERLVSDLGKAVRLFPALARGLNVAKPVGCALSPAEAYDFLREKAWLLEESGFGVLVPSWWKNGRVVGPRLGVKVRVNKSSRPAGGVGGFGRQALLQYDWQLALGEHDLTPEEFRRLARLKSPLVQVRGQWVELQPDQLQAAMKFFDRKKAAGESLDLAEALRMALGGEEETESGLPVVGMEAQDAELAKVLDRLSGAKQVSRVRPPKAFQGALRPYQVQGLSWLAFLRDLGLGGCLADDMGLGKTIQVLALLLRDCQRGWSGNPVLLICPTSVATNWRRESNRFAPSLKVMVHHGPQRLRKKKFRTAAKKHHLVVTTYALALRDQDDLQAVSWQGVILDEAQYIKNPGAKQTRAIRSLPAEYRFALTGTPVENRLTEFWSIMQFLNPGFLGSQRDFRRRFAAPIERYQDEEAADRLRRLTRPFLLRRVKTDRRVIRDLPEKIETLVYCTLTPEQATLYQAVVDEMLDQVDEVDGIQRRGLVLAAMMKLKQICNHPAQFLGDGSPLDNRSGKLHRLHELLDELLAAGDRALLFTQFAEMGALLQQDLQQRFGRETLFLHGGVAKKKRDELVARFQDEHGPPFFVLSLKAGGVGLNLTQANHVFHFDRWWNPAVENQATDRAFRIGQTRNVQVHKFVCTGTLEERIQEMLETKQALADAIVGSGETWITELTTDELRELFTLRAQAVAES